MQINSVTQKQNYNKPNFKGSVDKSVIKYLKQQALEGATKRKNYGPFQEILESAATRFQLYSHFLESSYYVDNKMYNANMKAVNQAIENLKKFVTPLHPNTKFCLKKFPTIYGNDRLIPVFKNSITNTEIIGYSDTYTTSLRGSLSEGVPMPWLSDGYPFLSKHILNYSENLLECCPSKLVDKKLCEEMVSKLNSSVKENSIFGKVQQKVNNIKTKLVSKLMDVELKY